MTHESLIEAWSNFHALSGGISMLGFLMEQQGVSQYQLARECNVDQGNLSRILSGESGISKELAKRLAERFTVSVESFSDAFRGKPGVRCAECHAQP